MFLRCVFRATSFLRLQTLFIFFKFFVFIKKRFFEIEFTIVALDRLLKNAKFLKNLGYFIKGVTRFPVPEVFPET